MISNTLRAVNTEAHKYYNRIHISIFIPVTNSKAGSFQTRNRVRFCMSLRKIEKMLLDKGYSFIKVREVLRPLEMRVEHGIWRRNCCSVAIFAQNGEVKIFSLDIPVKQSEFIGDTFCMDPLEKVNSVDYQIIMESLSNIHYQNAGRLSILME